ncbi:MAG: sorbosone dehydrogenase family protein [Beijerinckiaceae bacterium]
MSRLYRTFALGCMSAAALTMLAVPAARAQRPPGLAENDKSNPKASGQAGTLRPHPTPAIPPKPDQLPLAKIKLPAGFKAEIWSSGHAGGRTMVRSPNGTIFVGTRQIGRVYAIIDKDGKREVKIVAKGLTQPNGLAFRDGALYVFAINRVFKYDGIEGKLDNPGEPRELTAAYNLPPEIHHNWKYVDFGPDGKMYVQVGANCNICELDTNIRGQIRRYNADGTGMEVVARGVRNTVGFDWHPETKELWFTDNGRDWAGNDGPQDELNRLPKGRDGANFGFPYCHANAIPDKDVTKPEPCKDVVMPSALLGPHAAGLGIKFYTGSMFPASYRNVAFIARHGSWNREKKYGYDVVVARTQPDGSAKIEPFLQGLLDEGSNQFFGRPAYVLQMPDGALLVSDDRNGAIYRISYSGPK